MAGIDRRGFLQQSAAAAAAAALGARGGLAQGKRPNFLFIITDDQNPDTLGCWGGNALTPRIDALASQGVKLMNNYVHCALCSASRYTCMTGRYIERIQDPGFLKRYPPGTQTNVGWDTPLEQDYPTLPSVLQQNGYRTGFCGKWHVGGNPQGHRAWAKDAAYDDPQLQRQLKAVQGSMQEVIRSRGYDYADAIYWGNTADYNLDSFDVHNPEWVTDAGLRFLDQHGQEPFYLYFATTIHHGPSPQLSIKADPRITPAGYLDKAPDCQPPRETLFERVKAAGLPEQRAFCTWLDDSVGALLDKLDALGVADNTMIIYFSDNGNPGKGTCYESGGHTPCFATWPGHIKPGTSDERLTSNVDFAPTILEAAGIETPKEMADGRSLLPLFEADRVRWRDSLYLQAGHSRAVVTDDGHKYLAVRHAPGIQKKIDDGTLGRPPYHMDQAINLQVTAAKVWPRYFDKDQLYNLKADPKEQTNLASATEQAGRMRDMKDRLRQYQKDVGRPFGEFVP